MATKGKATKKAGDVTDVEPKAPKGTGALERHPLSEKYGPPVTPEELLGLGTDMKTHGQHDDIILYEGKVLAGWNRALACMQMGIKPKTKNMAEGEDPVAVAFGTNFVRRRLNSVQKAFFGAQFAVDTDAKQTDVAKIVGCNLNRLNQCCQLIKLANGGNKEAAEAIEKLRTNPEISGAVFEQILAEQGIARTAPAPLPAPSAPSHTNTHSNGLDDDEDFLGGDEDLTGGAIDSLLDLDEEPLEAVEPAKRRQREIGEDADPLPTVGGKSGTSHSAQETIPSRLAKAFRKLAPAEQLNFVVFAGTKMAVAVNAAIASGKFTLDIPANTESPKPDKKKHSGGSKVDPSVIVPMPLKKGTEPPPPAEPAKDKQPKGKAAKAAAAAKKTPAKKAPAAKKAAGKK